MSTARLPASASVLIPTYQAARFLDRVLTALQRQVTEFPWDLLALDCGSTDGTLEIFTRHASSFPVPLKVVPHDGEAFDHGDARNRLATLSSGELLVFLTDDAIPATDDWLARLHANFADDQIAAVYCRHVPRPDARPAARIATTDDPTYAPTSRDQVWPAPREAQRLDPESMRALFNFSDSASAVRRAIWERNPYPRGDAEDVRFARPVIEAGFVVRFDASCVVQHTHDWEPPAIQRRAAIDGDFNARFLGRVCLRSPREAEATYEELHARDRVYLQDLALTQDELHAEVERSAHTRRAFVDGVLLGSRTRERERPTAMLENARVSATWILRDPPNCRGVVLDRANLHALARAWVSRGNSLSLLASGASRNLVDGLEGVKLVDRIAVPTAAGSRDTCSDVIFVLGAIDASSDDTTDIALVRALANRPTLLESANGCTQHPFGLSSRASRESHSPDRIEYRGIDPDRFDPSLCAALLEVRARSVLCRASGTVLLDRFASDADRRSGDLSDQGRFMMLLGFAPAALEFDTPDLGRHAGPWRIEIDVELLAHETDVPMGGCVILDERRIGHIGPLCSEGRAEIVRVGFDLPDHAAPRTLRIENRVRLRDLRTFRWSRHGRLRLRRVRIVRRDVASPGGA